MLVDLDATPGATHKILARYATARCVALGSPGADVHVTGAPVRSDVLVLDRSLDARQAAKTEVNPPIDASRRVVVVMTGSLGATRVNRAALELAQLWRDRRDLALVHITGRRDYEMVEAAQPAWAGLDYRVIDFADMSTWGAVADGASCRAGATTVAELTTLALPAILVPLPGAPGDHQARNADALAAVGAARTLRDAECTGETLATLVAQLLSPAVWAEMSRASSLLARRDAAVRIAQVALSVVSMS